MSYQTQPNTISFVQAQMDGAKLGQTQPQDLILDALGKRLASLLDDLIKTRCRVDAVSNRLFGEEAVSRVDDLSTELSAGRLADLDNLIGLANIQIHLFHDAIIRLERL